VLVKGGNYQHPFAGDAGTPQAPLHMGAGLIAGGAWYFAGEFPSQYHGSYFITDWRAHTLRRMLSEDRPEVVGFATGTRNAAQTRVGPDGCLYWLSTTYETLNGTVYRIRFRPGTPVADAPIIEPEGGTFDEPVPVRLATKVAEGEIRYTLDGSEPSVSSPLYEKPFALRRGARVKARVFAEKTHPSETAVAQFDVSSPAFVPEGLELAGHWPMDDGEGRLARDISGHGRHGRVLEAEWKRLPDGRVTLAFEGRGGHVDTGNWDIESPEFSITAWIRPETFPPGNADQRVVAKATGEAEGDHYWMLSTFRAGDIRLRFRLKTGGVTSTLVSLSGNLPAGEWSHVAATYDGQAKRLYLDGTLVGTMARTGEPDRHPGVPVWLGANPRTQPPRTFPGRLRDVRIYRRALEDSELRDLIRQTAPARDKKADPALEEKHRIYESALGESGDVAAGREIFMERCQMCHAMEDNGGGAMGADLRPSAAQPADWWLTALLDPNREVAPEYWNYRVETLSGDVLEGLLTGETAGSVTLRPLLGEPQTFPRTDLRRFERLSRSLMPEGLESGLSPAQMAGLIEYLRSSAASESEAH
jgi:putative heme-binding domain-containing protein